MSRRLTLGLLVALPIWLLYLAAMLPLMLIGAYLVMALCVTDSYHIRTIEWRPSQKYPDRMVMAFKPRWCWLWCNEEDGIDGSAAGFWPAQHAGSGEDYWQILKWSAWRNSVGNARWTKVFGMTVDPYKRRWIWAPAATEGELIQASQILRTGPYLVRQGCRFELKAPWSSTRYFWIGWRIAQQVNVTSGVGFAFQPWAKL